MSDIIGTHYGKPNWFNDLQITPYYIDEIGREKAKPKESMAREYRKLMVDMIITTEYEPLIPGELLITLPKWNDVRKDKLSTQLDRAFNTPIQHISVHDQDTFMLYIIDQHETLPVLNELSLGDAMYIYATKLTRKFGGSVLFWLTYMFDCVTQTVVVRDLGQVLINIGKMEPYNSDQYGIFGEKYSRFTAGELSFNAQYLRFLGRIKRN